MLYIIILLQSITLLLIIKYNKLEIIQDINSYKKEIKEKFESKKIVYISQNKWFYNLFKEDLQKHKELNNM